MGFEYIYERFSSDDWALEGVTPTIVPNLLAVGATPWNYTANVLYFNATYRLAPN